MTAGKAPQSADYTARYRGRRTSLAPAVSAASAELRIGSTAFPNGKTLKGDASFLPDSHDRLPSYRA
jgi:hypothetical protein